MNEEKKLLNGKLHELNNRDKELMAVKKHNELLRESLMHRNIENGMTVKQKRSKEFKGKNVSGSQLLRKSMGALLFGQHELRQSKSRLEEVEVSKVSLSRCIGNSFICFIHLYTFSLVCTLCTPCALGPSSSKIGPQNQFHNKIICKIQLS